MCLLLIAWRTDHDRQVVEVVSNDPWTNMAGHQKKDPSIFKEIQFPWGFPIWGFPKMVVPQNGWFLMEKPYQNGWFLGENPPFKETPIYLKYILSIHISMLGSIILSHHPQPPQKTPAAGGQVTYFCAVCVAQSWGFCEDVDVSENRGTPKSYILRRFSIINHPFLGTTIFGNIHVNVWWVYLHLPKN